MKYRILISLAASASTLLLLACQQPVVTHKLVATGTQHTVPMYPDEQTYLHVSREKQSGGVEGMVGDVKQQFQAREIDDQTQISVVSSDDNGSVVQVIDGPMKGASGFVAKQNVD